MLTTAAVEAATVISFIVHKNNILYTMFAIPYTI